MLVCACQMHGTLQILRAVKLHIDVDVTRQPTSEELRLLTQRETPCVRRAGLERFHIGIHRRSEGQARQVRQMVRAEGRTEALLAQRAELLPLRPACVGFEDQVPLLSNSGEVI